MFLISSRRVSASPLLMFALAFVVALSELRDDDAARVALVVDEADRLLARSLLSAALSDAELVGALDF